MHSYKIILFLFLSLITCGGDDFKPVHLKPLAREGVVLAFGDSLTLGIGADQGYPERLSRLIGRKVVKSGVSGEKTSQGLKRLAQVLEQIHPSLLILCEGGNDFLGYTSEESVAKNLESMITLAQKKGIDVLLISVPQSQFKLEPPALYEQIAVKFGIPLEKDVLVKIGADNSLLSDPIHPNGEGYQMMAEALAKILKQYGAIQ